jgi:hypothetical protein
VIFLGRPREERLTQARDASGLERLGLLWLAAGCVLLGLFPVAIIEVIDPIPYALVGRGLAQSGHIGDWMLLAPVSAERASYSPLVVFIVTLAIVILAIVLVRRFYHGRLRHAAAWDCGYPPLTARMQDTAEGFGQPIRQIFEPLFRMQRELPTAHDAEPRYRVEVSDPMWRWIYVNIAVATERVSRLVGLLQRGRIAIYLLYSFLTLVAMLFLTQA